MKTKHLLGSFALGLGLALALLWSLSGTHVARADRSAERASAERSAEASRRSPGTIYVSTTGADGPACGTAGSPCRTIPYAVDNRAQSGDTVSVAAGTFTETFALKAGVVIQGAGAGVTIVDGEDVRGPMVTASGFDVGSNAVLRDLTIRRGNASWGGGVFIEDGAAPIIKDCSIQENTATLSGGGLYIFDASPTIENTQVLNNQAVRDGGGVCVYWYASPTIIGGQIAANTAISYDGGGLLVGWYSSPIINGTQINGNTAGTSGGGAEVGEYS